MADRPPFAVEPMQLADLPEVMAIERLAFSAPWSERAYRFEIEENENGAMLVARARGAAGRRRAGWPAWLARLIGRPGPVVGYGGLWLLVDEAHISTLAVHPEWRGRGLGELLLLGLLDRGQALGARMATLEVRISNDVAQGLYEKYGFEVAGRQRRYYSDNNEDAYIMATPPFDTPEWRQTLAHHRAALDDRLRARS